VVAIHKKKSACLFNLFVTGLIMAGWLSSADPTVQLYLDVTLPSPTCPSLRMSVPRNIPATLLTLPKTLRTWQRI